jgi:uncharacterized protein YdiU (UPF0061 family)
MRRKLGILHASSADDEADRSLIVNLMETMQQAAADYSNTFRLLRSVSVLAFSRVIVE